MRSRRIAIGTAIAALTIATSLAAPPQPAVAAVMVDQQQTGIDEEQIRVAGGEASIEIAQLVTVGLAGDLVRVDLPVQCVGGADLIIEIRDVASGVPGTAIKSTTTVTGSTIPPFWTLFQSPSLRAFTLASTVPVTVGEKIAIVLRSTGTVAATNACGTFAGPVGETYAGGDAYFKHTQGAPSWTCFCVHADSAEDLAFRTWVDQKQADLAITKTLVNPSNLNVFSGTEQLYQLTITNAGPDTATNVTLVDTLPAGVTYLVGPGSCTNNAGTLTCTIAPTQTQSTLAAGSSTTITFKVSFDTAGSYTNTATVSANETDASTANNTSSHTQQVLPTADLIISNVFAPGVVGPGDTFAYDVTVQNVGPDPAGQVVLLQTIPAGTTFVSVSSPDTVICGPGTSTKQYGCRFSAIPVNAKRSMTVTVMAPSTPQMLMASFDAQHLIPPLIFDPPPLGVTSYPTWVVAETVTQTVGAGGSATTDVENDGATPGDPLETTVQTPSAGAVTITEQRFTGAPPRWTGLGVEIVISAPAGTAANPITLTFRFDSSFLGGFTAATLQIFRNGVAVPVCATNASGNVVLPLTTDPCVKSRSTLADGDVEIVVLTSQASVWRFATPPTFDFNGLFAPLHPGTNTVNAGRAVTVKFSLSGFQTMVILDGPLASRPTSCESGSPFGPLTTVDLVGGGLRYDPNTDAYSLSWKTDPTWAGTCRELVLSLIDGTKHSATFAFK